MTNPYVELDSYNQDVYTMPGFVPERVAPVFEHLTYKYYCQEKVMLASGGDQFQSLTWKIQQPDMSMVARNIKVCIPIRIRARDNRGDTMSMDISDRYPACNTALSSNLQKAFSDIELSINGKIFSVQPARFFSVLDKCYNSKDFMGFPSNHSLKPVANTNLRSRDEFNDTFPVYNNAGQRSGTVTLSSVENRVSRNAFNLAFANGPFIERVRDFQTRLQGKGYWDDVLIFELDVGPFMSRARKRTNMGVPFIRDMYLRMRWDSHQSQFDIDYPPSEMGGYKAPDFPDRTTCTRLLEFGTPVNLAHHRSGHLPTRGWAGGGYSLAITAQPYLSVDYVKMGGLAPSYTLRAFDFRYEKSNMFSLIPSTGENNKNLISSTSLARINTRLTSLPSKVYLYCELADGYKNPFFWGGVTRFCRLKNIKLRINQRTNVVDSQNCTEQELYEQFVLNTSNSLQFPAWRKSPVYVFTQDYFGQPDMLANDGVVNTFEWEAECELTELQIQELVTLHTIMPYHSMGYKLRFAWSNSLNANGRDDTDGQFFDVRLYADYPYNYLDPTGQEAFVLPSAQAPTAIYHSDQELCLLFSEYRDSSRQTNSPLQILGYSNIETLLPHALENLLKPYIFEQSANIAIANVNTEAFLIKSCPRIQYRFDDMYWGIVDITNGTHDAPLVDVNGIYLWYVPQSFLFDFEPSDVYTGEYGSETWAVRKQIFNNLGEIDWAPLPHGPPTVPAVSIMTGMISQRDSRSIPNQRLDPQRVAFNKIFQYPTIPGPRAYPMSDAGIWNVGWHDGGANAAGGQFIQGGVPARPHGDASHVGWQYLNNMQGGQNVAANYRWVCFQAPAGIVDGSGTDPSRNWGQFIAPFAQRGDWDNNQVPVNGDNAKTGSVQFPPNYNFVVGHAGQDRVPSSGITRTIVRCEVEQNCMGTAPINALPQEVFSNAGVPPARFAGNHIRVGLINEPTTASQILKWEMKVLYEYGEGQYVMKKDGSKPEKLDNIVLKQQFNSDPRTQENYSLKAPPSAPKSVSFADGYSQQ